MTGESEKWKEHGVYDKGEEVGSTRSCRDLVKGLDFFPNAMTSDRHES